MQEFYKEMLLNGNSPNEALRAAQLKMWQKSLILIIGLRLRFWVSGDN
jgi:CHAT domain-containing protein